MSRAWKEEAILARVKEYRELDLRPAKFLFQKICFWINMVPQL